MSSDKNTSNDSIENFFKGGKAERAPRGEGGSAPDKRKQSLYFPESMVEEMKAEAARLDRSLSWVVQKAWKLAKSEIAQIPSATTEEGDEA